MPSPVAHMLSGVFIASVPAITHRKYNRTYFAVAAFCAAAPDLDMLLVYVGVDYFIAHRTFSHSFPFALGTTFLLWCANYLAVQMKKNVTRIPYVLVGACLICHILMDLLGVDERGPRGLMLFWPLWNDFFYPAIHLFQSPFDMHGNLASLNSLAVIALSEIVFTCVAGLLLLLAVRKGYGKRIETVKDD